MATKQEPPRFNERQRPKRLVIDFHQGLPRALTHQRAGRWLKLLALLGVVMVLVAIVAAGSVYFWWQHYKTLPAYSLALLVDASQRNDLTVVDQVVDTDRIIDNLAAQITEKTAERYGATLGPSMRQRVEALVPALLPSLRESVRGALAKRVREISERSEPKPFVVLAIGLPYYVDINSESDSAKVKAPVRDQQIELTLKRNGDRWKVVAMKDDAVVQRIVDDIIKEFPAVGQFR